MLVKNELKFNLNNFMDYLKVKKKYLKKLNERVLTLKEIKLKNYKTLSYNFFRKKNFNKSFFLDYLVMYIVDFSFSKTNITLNVMDAFGNLKFSCSAGSLKFKGKQKKSKFVVLKRFFNLLFTKLKFLSSNPIALHLKNAVSFRSLIVRQLKKFFFIRIVKDFQLYPHNGCRRRKLKRKKMRTRKKKLKNLKKWLSGLKRQIVNLLSFLVVGSNPSFFLRDIA